VKEVLESLLDQEVVLNAARKEKFSDAELDKKLNSEMPKSVEELARLEKKLVRDLAAVRRVRKTFKDDYSKMITAQAYAQVKVKDVVVTEKEMKDRYDEYVAESRAQGEKARPYAQVKDQVRVRTMADKMLTRLREEYKAVRQEDAIQKFLARISPSQQVLKKD
jgi:hypothetical protein